MEATNSAECQILFSKGKNCLLNLDFVNAFEYLHECLKLTASKIMQLEVHNLLGQCGFALGSLQLAEYHFKEGIKINEQSERGLLVTGFCYLNLKNYDKALELAQQVLDNPKTEFLGYKKVVDTSHWKDAYVLKCKVYVAIGDMEMADQMIEKICEWERIKEKELETAILSALPNNLSGKIDLEDLSITYSDPRASEVLFKNGKLEMTIGCFDNAISDFEKLLKMDPNHFEGLCFASVCLGSTGRYEQAEKYIIRALDIDPDNQQAKDYRVFLNGKNQAQLT